MNSWMYQGACDTDCDVSNLGGQRVSNAWNNDFHALNNFMAAKTFTIQESFERAIYLHDLGQNGTVQRELAKLGPHNRRQQFAIAKFPTSVNFRLNSRHEQGSRKLNDKPRLKFCSLEVGNDMGMMIKYSEDEIYEINQLLGFNNYQAFIEKMWVRGALNTTTQGILADLILKADPCNIGPNAGILSGSVNTGTQDDPLPLLPDDIPNMFHWADRIFDERNITPNQLNAITGSSRKSVIMPKIMNEFFSDSKLIERMGIAQCSDICQYYMNGTFDYSVHGWEIIYDNCLYQMVEEVDGKKAFPIIFVHHGAFAYNAMFDSSRFMQGPAPYEHRDWYWEAEMYYGYMLLHPELVTVFWVTLPDFNA